MLNIRYETGFKKDYKAAIKRGYNPKLLEEVVDLLVEQKNCHRNTKIMRYKAIMPRIENVI